MQESARMYIASWGRTLVRGPTRVLVEWPLGTSKSKIPQALIETTFVGGRLNVNLRSRDSERPSQRSPSGMSVYTPHLKSIYPEFAPRPDDQS